MEKLLNFAVSRTESGIHTAVSMNEAPITKNGIAQWLERSV